MGSDPSNSDSIQRKLSNEETSTSRDVDPVTEESKLIKEYRSVNQSTIPFMTSTGRGANVITGTNVITTTTSRSTREERVEVFSEKSEDEETEEDEEEGSEEVSRKQ